MTTEKDLIIIKNKTALSHFNSDEGLNPLISQVKDLIANFEHDLSTKASRARTASLAAKVSSFKIKIDGLGKDLVAEWKAKSKKVDATRKEFRDAMDSLRDAARQPLTDWEEEQKRIEEAERLKREAEELAKQKENDHEIAILLDREFDRLKAEEAAEVERAQKAQAAEQARLQVEREAALVEQAKADAEKAAEQEKARAEKAERDAIIAKELAKAQAEKAEADRIAALSQAKVDAEAAAEQARLAEVARQQAEQKRIADEQAERERNKAHISKVRKSAKEHLMRLSGVSEDLAKSIVLHLSKNKIDEISINY